MFKLDFSDIQENGYRINQLRLFHSSKFRGLNFEKNKKYFTDNDDLPGERDLFTEYLIENNEIAYSYYLVFAGLALISFIILLLTFFVFGKSLIIEIISLLLTVFFYFLARKRKEDFVMGNMGIDLSESWYNSKIKDKYNLK
jgi:hypothetical protein